MSGSSAALYATTNTVGNNSLVSFTDSAAYNTTLSGSFTTLASAGANFWFRGVAFAPKAVNAAPVVTLNGGDVSYTENDPATVLASAATVTDADSANFDTGTLTVEFSANGTSDDRLAIRNQGTGSGQIGVSGSNVTFGGTTIGTFTGGTGTTALVVTLNANATPTATQALVRNITFANVSENPSTATRGVRFALTDGDGGTSTPVTRDVTVVAVNDAPVVTAPATAETNEDTGLVFSSANSNAITVADVDAGTANLTVTLTAGNGTATLGSTANLTVSGNGTASVTLTGTLTAINTGLSGLTFNPTANFNGSTSLQVSANDSGNTGTGGALTDAKTVSITVASVNDAPTGADRSATINEDATYTFTAADFGFADPNDTPANAFVGVVFTALPSSSLGTLRLGASTVSANQFVALADITSFGLVFTPAANANGTPYATFTFRVRDGGGTDNGGADFSAAPNTFTLNVTAVNDAPVVTTSSGATSYTENGSGVPIDTGLTVSDVDSATLTGATVRITANFAAGQDVLGFTNQNGISGTYNATNGTLTLAGSASLADYETALRSVTYSNSSDDPSTLTRTIAFAVNDGAAPSSDATKNVTVVAVNDAPVITAPATASTGENATLIFSALNGNAISLSDPDAGAGEFQVVLTPTNGGVTVNTVPGVTLVASGGILVLSGTLNPLNDTLSSVAFLPNTNFSGSASLQISVIETSIGLGLSDTETVAITVTGVNNAPAGTDGSATINEDATYTFSAADFGFTDPNDSPANAFAGVVITTLPTAGALTLDDAPLTAGTFVTAEDLADGLLVFTPVQNANGTPYATFTFQVRDTGGTSSNGQDTDQSPNTFTLNVTAVNDAPSLTLAQQTVSVPFNSGAFTLANFATFAPGGGADEATQTAQSFTVTPSSTALFAVQPTIDASGTLRFTPATGMSGTLSFDVTVTDSGGATSAPVSFSITIGAAPVVTPPPVNVAADPTARFIAAGADAGSNGTVRLFDARTGTPLAAFQPFGNFSGGVAVALGDLTGDGVAELVVATRGSVGLIAVFNLATGATLVPPVRPFALNTGLQIATGDLDGDGVHDLVFSPERGSTAVFGFSFTKSAFVSAFEAVPGANLKYQLTVGNVTGDGRAEVVLSANGLVGVFGPNGGLLSAFAVAPGFAGDMSVAVGDTDGDGKREIVVALQGPGAATAVGGFSAEGALVWSLFADTGAGLRRDGSNRPATSSAPSVAVADVTGDGIADVLFGSQTGMGTSRITIVNGATRQTVRTDLAFDPLSQIGVFTDAG